MLFFCRLPDRHFPFTLFDFSWPQLRSPLLLLVAARGGVNTDAGTFWNATMLTHGLRTPVASQCQCAFLSYLNYMSSPILPSLQFHRRPQVLAVCHLSLSLLLRALSICMYVCIYMKLNVTYITRSYSTEPGSKCRPGDQLCWIRFYAVFLSPFWNVSVLRHECVLF